MTHRVTASRRASVEGQKKRPPGQAGAEAYLQLALRKGEATVKALNHPKRDLESSSFRSRMRSKTVTTQRVTTSRKISPEGKENQTKPSFQSRTYQPQPRRGDPIAKVANPMGEENPQEPTHPEQAGEGRTGKMATNPVAKETVGAQPQDSKSTYQRLIVWQQMRPGEDSPPSNNKSDKQDKSAAASNKKGRRSEGGRRNTTTVP